MATAAAAAARDAVSPPMQQQHAADQAPDLSQALPDGVLRAIVSRLELFDAVAFAATCVRLRAIVDQEHARLEVSSSGRSSSGADATSSGGRATVRAVARRSALRQALSDGAWRWPLLPAVERDQQRGARGHPSSGGRRGGPARVEHAAYFAPPPAVVANAAAIITDAHATAFFAPLPSAAAASAAVAETGGSDKGAGGTTAAAPTEQNQQPQAEGDAPHSTELRLLQGHLPPTFDRTVIAGPVWHLPGRHWPRLRHVIAPARPRTDATADGLAEWPPRLAAPLAHGRWLDAESEQGSLVVSASEGDPAPDAGARMQVGGGGQEGGVGLRDDFNRERSQSNCYLLNAFFLVTATQTLRPPPSSRSLEGRPANTRSYSFRCPSSTSAARPLTSWVTPA